MFDKLCKFVILSLNDLISLVFNFSLKTSYPTDQPLKLQQRGPHAQIGP